MNAGLIVAVCLGAIALVAFAIVARFGLTRASNMKAEVRRAGSAIAASDTVFAGTSPGARTTFTVLVENHGGEGLDALGIQHGISILAERGGLSFILDLGADDLYSRNASALGQDLGDVSFAFLSHGHSDHGGGLGHFLTANSSAAIYVTRQAMTGRYVAKIADVIRKDISLDGSLVNRYPDRFVFPSTTTEIAPDLFVVPTITRRHRLPAGNGNLFKKESGTLVADDFDHESLLAIRDSDGLIIFSGCCHNGILNVLDTIHAEFPDRRIKAVIGGFHLFSPTRAKIAEKPSDVRSLAEALLASEGTLYITGHCTGTEAYGILKEILGDRLAYFSTGRTFAL
jgi:7,8-dihydropterin-6-yl-methyl-4-(beta-D-ribofuranosyl)aminobenzene 5'-phosphate synthase